MQPVIDMALTKIDRGVVVYAGAVGMSLMLLDSASLWYRAYFGMPDTLFSPKGRNLLMPFAVFLI
jgi:hypothetical protein